MTVSIIIPLYKKIEECKHNLTTNWQYFGQSEVIVVNDNPTDKIQLDTDSFYSDKKIILMHTESNGGFAPTVNLGVRRATGDILFILNTDVLLESADWQRALQYFTADPLLFAVSLATREQDGRVLGRNEVYFDKGLFHHRGLSPNMSPAQENAVTPNGWAELGSALVRKSMWQRLGGLDEAYAPFYWEDVDISYRAKKQGWKVLLDQGVIVQHHHESTIGSFYTKEEIKKIAYRNQQYFTQKFARGPLMISSILWRLKRLFMD